MREKRRSARVNYLGTGWLQQENLQHFCRLENISTNGALVSLKKSLRDTMLQGYNCRLTLYYDAEGHSKEFTVKVVHCEAAQVGLEFVDLDSALESTLTAIVIREQQFISGAQTIINLARALAEDKGVALSDVHFDAGKLNPEKEIHLLRFFAGKHSVMVDLNRNEVEQFHTKGAAAPSQAKIRKAVDRLDGLLKG
jgi:hypothetical protein